MTRCGCLLSRSLSGAKRTYLFAPHMSAFDPKRTCKSRAEGRRLLSSGRCWSFDLCRHYQGPLRPAQGNQARRARAAEVVVQADLQRDWVGIGVPNPREYQVCTCMMDRPL